MDSNLKFGHIKKGDALIRLLSGVLPMKVVVGDVDDTFIYTGSEDGKVHYKEGWKFRRDNGAEVDEEIGWDGITQTGSYLKK